MSIGKVLSELINQYNLNVLELERMTGVPSSTLYRLLKEKNINPTIEVLKKLAYFFQISVSQLIGEEVIGCKQVPFIKPAQILNFIHRKVDIEQKTVPIDFPINTKSFATLSKDNMMEPFILYNSIIIIDPEREITNKDFVILIKNIDSQPIIRQIICDDGDYYIKILNSNFPLELKKINLLDYEFKGVIVHYRTNLYSHDNNIITNNEMNLFKNAL